RALLEKATVHSPSLGIKALVGCIFAHNHPSLALFAQLGFERWGFLPRIAQVDNVACDLILVGRPVGSSNSANKPFGDLTTTIAHSIHSSRIPFTSDALAPKPPLPQQDELRPRDPKSKTHRNPLAVARLHPAGECR